MTKTNLILLLLPLLALSSCQDNTKGLRPPLSLVSPDEQAELTFFLTENGSAAYRLQYGDETLIDTSTLGFELQDAPRLQQGLEITGQDSRSVNDQWEMPWGEQRVVVNRYNELAVELQETPKPKRRFRMVFRLYDDGLGFRYEFPEQEGFTEMVVMDELTQFQLTGDHDCWWIPGDWDIYEHLYNETKVSEIDAISKRDHPNLAQTTIPYNAVNTPVTMRTASGLHLSFHEARLTDYAGMTLKVDTDSLLLESGLVGSDRLGYKAKRQLPFHTPWRTVQFSKDAPGLIESKLIVNLNEPNQLGDIPWFKPTKYIG
ncbi:MAG TPA: glycoside hydrolase family 97 N-terminal domain-containing protein, partial [Phaeodactylibacter sp.]|nr:glycoside hydrolase family 97 N-terminal domain-containing protein [Phaeodactylibacter sp.]